MNIGNPISSIIKRATKKSERLNIITWTTHERYDVNLANINADFYVLKGEGCRTWNEKYSKTPSNFFYVDKIPEHITIDCIISGNPFVHIPLGIPISKQLHSPLLNIFHTEPPNAWTKEAKIGNTVFLDQCAHHVFITEENLISWHFKNDKNCSVIEHGVDSKLFNPGNLKRNDTILTVGNDFINRNQELGFDIWRGTTQGLPVKVVGSTPGLSQPAESLEDLITEYQTSRIYLNTSLRSPLPMSLIEAAACGCAIATTNTNAIADFFTHGHDCYIFSPNELDIGRSYLVKLLEDKEECKRLATNARKTVLERFDVSRFVGEWEYLLQNVCGRVFK